LLLNRLFTIIAEQQPEKRQEDKWLCGELTAGAYELNFPTSMPQLEGEKERDDDDDEKGGEKEIRHSGEEGES
jgi:hypothetical protein